MNKFLGFAYTVFTMYGPTRPQFAVFVPYPVQVVARLGRFLIFADRPEPRFCLLEVEVSRPPDHATAEHLQVFVPPELLWYLQEHAMHALYAPTTPPLPHLRAQGVMSRYRRKSDESLDYGINLLYDLEVKLHDDPNWVPLWADMALTRIRRTTGFVANVRRAPLSHDEELAFAQQDEVLEMHHHICGQALGTPGICAVAAHQRGERLDEASLDVLRQEVRQVLQERGHP